MSHLVGVGYDTLYIWNWRNLKAEPQIVRFDNSWVPLDFRNDPIIKKPSNYKYSLIGTDLLAHAIHQRDDMHIVVRAIDSEKEFNRWPLSRRWDCWQLRNTQNAQHVAVHLRENFDFVLADRNRKDEGRHRLGILSEGDSEIRWVSVVYMHSGIIPNISSIAVSEDGRYLAAVGTDSGGFIHVADVTAKKVLWQKVPHGAEVPHGEWTVNFNDVCFSPDSKHIYVAGNFGLFCFETETGKILSQWQIDGRLVSVAMTPDARLVAGGTEISGFVYIWDAETGNLLMRITTDQGTHYRLAFSPDSTLLATSGTRGDVIKFWKMPASDWKPKSVTTDPSK